MNPDVCVIPLFRRNASKTWELREFKLLSLCVAGLQLPLLPTLLLFYSLNPALALISHFSNHNLDAGSVKRKMFLSNHFHESLLPDISVKRPSSTELKTRPEFKRMIFDDLRLFFFFLLLPPSPHLSPLSSHQHKHQHC